MHQEPNDKDSVRDRNSVSAHYLCKRAEYKYGILSASQQRYFSNANKILSVIAMGIAQSRMLIIGCSLTPMHNVAMPAGRLVLTAQAVGFSTAWHFGYEENQHHNTTLPSLLTREVVWVKCFISFLQREQEDKFLTQATFKFISLILKFLNHRHCITQRGSSVYLITGIEMKLGTQFKFYAFPFESDRYCEEVPQVHVVMNIELLEVYSVWQLLSAIHGHACCELGCKSLRQRRQSTK